MGRPKTLREEQATAIGVSSTTISKYYKEGMPRDSVEGAKNWYFAKKGRGKVKSGNITPVVKSNQKKPAKTQPPLGTVTGDAPPPIPKPKPQKRRRIKKEKELQEKITPAQVNNETLRGLAYYVAMGDKKLKEHEQEIQEIRKMLLAYPPGLNKNEEDTIARADLLNRKFAFEKQMNDTAKTLTSVSKEISNIEHSMKDSYSALEVSNAFQEVAKGIKQIIDQMGTRLTQDLVGDARVNILTIFEKERDSVIKQIYEFDFTAE